MRAHGNIVFVMQIFQGFWPELQALLKAAESHALMFFIKAIGPANKVAGCKRPSPLVIASIAAIGLKPVPFLAEDFRYLRAAFVPILTNDVLNKFDIYGCDGSFSDGDEQHKNCITEKDLGRQQKVKKILAGRI